MSQRRIEKGWVIVFGCWMSLALWAGPTAWAQQRGGEEQASVDRSSFDLRGQSLDDALQRVATVARIDVAYPQTLVAGKTTDCVIHDADVEAVLGCVLNGQGLVYRRLDHGAYVIAKATASDSSRVRVPGPSYGSIRGVIREHGTEQPLAGANVVIVGTQQGTASGVEGLFEITPVPVGTYVLAVSIIGYETRRVERVHVRSGAVTDVEVILREALTPLREVVVTPGHFALLRRHPTAHRILSREELRRLPALGDDVYRAIRRLPGISGHDFSAKFTVRGGAYEEVLVRLDGMTLYEPFHLKDVSGGLFSIVDAEAIDGVDMMIGAFPVDYGNRLSGVIDIQSSVPSAERRRTSLGLSLTNVRFLSEGRFDGGKGQWMAVARRGYIDVLLKLIGADENFEPRYYDLYTKVRYPLHANHVLSTHALRAGDRTAFNETEFALDSDYSTAYHWLTWDATISPRLLAQTILSTGRITRNRTGVDFFDEGEEVVFSVADHRRFHLLGIRQDWTYEPTPRLLFKAGFTAERQVASYRYENQVREVETPTSPFDTTRVQIRPTGTAVGAYLAVRGRLTRALTAEAGLRYDVASWADDRALSPRLNVAYGLGPRTVLRAGWGWFYQSQGIHEMDVQDGEDVFYPAELARHRTLGVEHAFTNGLQIRVEAYQKKLSNLRPTYLNLPQDVLYSFPEAETGRVRLVREGGEAKGIEVLMKTNPIKALNGWGSYSLAIAEDDIDGATVPRYFDQRHTLHVGLGHRLSTTWDVQATWQFHSGWPYTAAAVERVTTPDGTYFMTTPGPINTERLPAYHRLDVRVSRHVTFSRSRLSIFLDVQNLYNRKNVRLYLPMVASVASSGEVTVRNTPDYFLPVLPSFGVRWDLFH